MVTPVVLGTHEYEWALWPFAGLFAKYWGLERVLYIGDRRPGKLPPNVDFMPVPAYDEGVWNWKYWFGNGLRSVCEAFAGHILAIFLLDHWLSSSVDRAGVDTLVGYMAHRPAVVRANLTYDLSWDLYAQPVETWQGLDIIAVPPSDIHAGLNGGVSFSPSLWRPELLAGLLEPYWDLWKCERLGTERMKQYYPDVLAVGSRPACLWRAHGLSQHSPRQANLTGLTGDDPALVRRYLPGGWREVA